jgi:hypothetical protein
MNRCAPTIFGVERDPIRCLDYSSFVLFFSWSNILFVKCRPWSNILFVIAPIPGFEGDVPILAIPLPTRPSDSQTVDDSAVETSANRPKTRTGKHKAPVIPNPQKKAKKSMGKFSGGIKINEPAPEKPASTPPSGS